MNNACYNGMGLLHYAAQSGQLKLVQRLLAMNAPPDQQAAGSAPSPLQLAANGAHDLVCLSLVQALADPTVLLRSGARFHCEQSRQQIAVQRWLDVGRDGVRVP
jgi:hypothetical protein